MYPHQRTDHCRELKITLENIYLMRLNKDEFRMARLRGFS